MKRVTYEVSDKAQIFEQNIQKIWIFQTKHLSLHSQKQQDIV